ncbi:MAG: NAD(P)/FAD-dependent oxidoreductase [Sporichthyaceae bacterium]
MPGERLLLVGAGHAHLHLIRHAAALRTAGYDLALLAPDRFDYSGTASAVAAGDLAPEQGSIDVAALARRRTVRHHVGRLADLDLEARTAHTEDGTRLDWDVVSLNVGSVADPGPLHLGPGVPAVKPLADLAALREFLREADGAVLTVVGAGASGVELAAHAASRLAGRGTVRLLQAGPDIAPALPAAARRRLARELRRRGVRIHLDSPVRELHADRVVLADGTTLRHDLGLYAGGLIAPPLLARLGLGDRDGVPVGASLTHPDHDRLYAVGDCARFLPGPLPKVGVHGVRQGPVLLAGLLARADGSPAPPYRPPRRALAILDLGDGRALAVRGRWWWEGRSPLWLKRRIDRRWLDRYRA